MNHISLAVKKAGLDVCCVTQEILHGFNLVQEAYHTL